MHKALEAIRPIFLEPSENDGVRVAEISNQLVQSIIADTTDSGDQALRAKKVDGADAQLFGTLVSVIADSMNALFDDSATRSSPSALLEGVRNDIRSAVSAAFNSGGPQFTST